VDEINAHEEQKKYEYYGSILVFFFQRLKHQPSMMKGHSQLPDMIDCLGENWYET